MLPWALVGERAAIAKAVRMLVIAGFPWASGGGERVGAGAPTRSRCLAPVFFTRYFGRLFRETVQVVVGAGRVTNCFIAVAGIVGWG